MPIVTITTQSDADFIRQFVLQDVTPAPINLSGWSLRMGVRALATDTNLPLLLTTENGLLSILNAAAGSFKIDVPQAVLARLPAGDYVHSLIRINGQTRLPVWRGTWSHLVGPSR